MEFQAEDLGRGFVRHLEVTFPQERYELGRNTRIVLGGITLSFTVEVLEMSTTLQDSLLLVDLRDNLVRILQRDGREVGGEEPVELTSGRALDLRERE